MRMTTGPERTSNAQSRLRERTAHGLLLLLWINPARPHPGVPLRWRGVPPVSPFARAAASRRPRGDAAADRGRPPPRSLLC